MSNLTSTIKSIQDIMRKDAGVDGDAQRISQLGWMLFLKIFDEKEHDWEVTNEDYKSPIPKDLRWRNWAADEEGMTGDELLGFVNNSLFPRLKDLRLRHNKDAAKMVKDVFEDSYNYMKSGTLLRQVINKINKDIHFSTQAERHAFNDIYEQILRDLQSAGNAGEFYTPRPVTQFIVEMVAPKLGEKVLDPACGTAGFLTNVIDFIQKNEGVKTLNDRAKLQNGIWGVEKKPLPHMLATTNMILHGIEAPSIDHDNLLTRSYIEFTSQRVDVIVTNPPFGGMEEDGVEKNFPVQFRTRETANLFLALIIQLLKPDGRCGVVLPDGFLFGEGVATRIKETLLEKCNLHTIVRLPNGVFAPYTGIKTNLLFFQKGKSTKEVWYFEHPYPNGVKTYNKTKPINIKEFDLEKAWWNKREENEYAWKVSVDEIKKRNYNLDIKNPNKILSTNLKVEDIEPVYKASISEIDLLHNEILSSIPDSAIEKRHALHLLNKYFNTFFDSQEGIKKLRETVIQLAIQGKLTSQNLTDEPAFELLTRIKKEKDKSANGKRTNKQTQPKADEIEAPFRLPQNWARCRFEDLCITITQGPNPKYTSDVEYEFRVLKTKDFYDDKILYEQCDQIGNKIFEEWQRFELKSGDIIFGLVGKGSTGKCNVFESQNDKRYIFTRATGLFRLVNQRLILPTFVKYFFNSVSGHKLVDEITDGSTGQLVIKTSEIKLLPFGLPPIDEQHRIVAKLERLLKMIKKLETQVKLKQTYGQQFLEIVLNETFEVNKKQYATNEQLTMAAEE